MRSAETALGRVLQLGIFAGICAFSANEARAQALTSSSPSTITLSSADTYDTSSGDRSNPINLNGFSETVTGSKTATFSGVISDSSSFKNGSLIVNTSLGAVTGLTDVANAGVLILSAKNTYTGDTLVKTGVLFLASGAEISSLKTTVSSGSILAGLGTIKGDLVNNGIVLPGSVSLGTLTTSQGSVTVSAGQLTIPAASAGTSMLTVKGNYTQSSTGTLVIQYASPTQHDLLAVQGKATLDGTLRLVQVNGGKLSVNDKVQILTATNGVTGTFKAVTDAALLNATVMYTANAVVLQVTQGSVTTALQKAGALSPNVTNLAKALDSAASDPRAAKTFAILNQDTLPQLAKDVQKINPDQVASTRNIATSVTNVHAQNVQRRADAIRSGVTGFSAAGFGITGNAPSSVEGMAGPTGPEGKGGKEIVPPPAENRWGAFISGAGQFNHVGDTETARGYNLTSGGFTLGVDFKATPNFAIGVFAGYTDTGINLGGDGGRTTVDAGKLGVYATYFTGGFYATAAAQGGYSAYEQNRNALAGVARSSPHGGDVNLLFSTGYDWKFGGLTIGPTAGFQYEYQGINGYTERGSAAPLEIDSQYTESLASTFGMKASYDWKVGSVVIKPEVRASWQHEYGDQNPGIESRLASGAGDTFKTFGADIGRDSMLVGAGFSVIWNDRTSTYVFYDGEFFRTNYDSNNVSGGIRITF